MQGLKKRFFCFSLFGTATNKFFFIAKRGVTRNFVSGLAFWKEAKPPLIANRMQKRYNALGCLNSLIFRF